MTKQPRHRPTRKFPDAKRQIYVSGVENCTHCGQKLEKRRNWHTSKTIQTLSGPLFIAGRAKECCNQECEQYGKRYYASQMLLTSLPFSTYGLDVLTHIGWQRDHEHRQFIEIQRELNAKGIVINERNVGKLYRQFLALLGATSEQQHKKLEETVAERGGLILGVDALQPEGRGGLLYVLYDVLSDSVVSAIQLEVPTEPDLEKWLQPYRMYPVLATLSDGEDRIIAALRATWPQAPHQRCQEHFLSNLAEEVLDHDTQLRKQMRADLGSLPKVDPASFF